MVSTTSSQLKEPSGDITETSELPTSGVAVAVLGELMVLVNGQTPALRRKDRALVAYLAINPQLQRRSTLVDLFFQEAGDPAAALRLALTRIRGQLGTDVLRSSDRQVSLDPAAYWLDLRRFDQLVGDDLSTSQPGDLVAAVALARGPLLERLHLPAAPEFDLWLLGERARVQRRVAQVLERLSDEAADAQRYDAAIQYARDLVAASPLLEEGHARLIRLYTQTHQYSAALAQFEQCRELLHRELAVAPSAELLALREGIRARDTAAATPPTPLTRGLLLLQPSPGFFERDHELAHLQALWEQTRGGSGAVVLLMGEAGAGKSRLLREFVRHLVAEQLQLGACSELTQQISYEPWVELLAACLSPGKLQALPRLWRDYLLRLLPGLAAQLEVEVPPAPPTAGGELDRLFAAVAEVLMPLGGPPQVIALEDLHWADAASLQLFGYLARRAEQRGVLLVGSLRTPEAQDEPAMKALLDGLERTGAARLPLPPLSEAAVSSLAGRFLKGAGTVNMRQVGSLVYGATGGNALFVTEVLRELASFAELPVELPIPSSIRDLIGRRLARVTDGERQVLEALAVLAAPTGLDEATDVSARSVAEVASAIDLGLRWGLLVSEPGVSPGPYRFGHQLPREAVVAQLSLARRQILHRRIAERLERGVANQPHEARLAVAERLLHHAQAGDSAELVVRWALPAAERATSLHAYAEALRRIDAGLRAYRTLRAAGRSSRHRHAYAELLLRRILVLDEIGHGYAAMSQHLDDAAAAITPRASELLQTLYRYCRAVVLAAKPDYELAIDEHLQVYDHFVQLGELRLAATCLMRASVSMRTISRNQEAYATTKRALAIYRELDDSDGERACHYGVGITLINLGRFEAARIELQKMLALATAQQSVLGEAHSHYMLGLAWHTIYQGERTVDHIAQAMSRFRQLDIPGMLARCLMMHGAGHEVIAWTHGGLEADFSVASTAYAESWRLAEELGDTWLSGWVAQLLGRRAFWDGDLAAARLWLERAAAIRHAAGELANQRSDLAWLSRLALAEGRIQEAVDLAAQALSGLDEVSKEFHVFELPDLYLVYGQALAASGDPLAARQALARAEAELARAAEQISDAEHRRHYLTASPLAQRVHMGID